MSDTRPRFYQFAAFRLERGGLKLTLDGRVVPLVPKALELLLILVEHRGTVVTKERLLDLLWPDTNVTEGNLSQTIYILRKALGDTSDAQRYVETVPRLGYRFVAEVVELRDALPDELPALTVARPETAAAAPAAAAGDGETPTPEPATSGQQARSATPPSGRRAATRLVKWSLAFAALAAVVAVALFQRLAPPAETGVSAGKQDINSLAVLPFKSTGEGAAEPLLGLGMTDLLIAKLGRLRRPSVLPTSSILRYTEADFDPAAAAAELRADAYLEGTVHRAGDRVRVAVRLVRAEGGQVLLAEDFDGTFANVFEVQDAAARRVAQALGHSLDNAEQAPTARRPARSIEAYQAYVRGLYFWSKRSEQGLERSVAHFADAAEKDPNYAAAHAGLADAYALLALDTPDPARRSELFEQSRATALRAKRLQGDLSEAHAALFLVKYYYDKDAEGAEQEIRQAISLNNAQVTSHLRYGLFHRDEGNLDLALAGLKRAVELDPLSWMGNVALCEVLWHRGENEPALEYCRRAVEIEPRLRAGPLHLAWVYTSMGRYEDAIRLLTSLPAEGIGSGTTAGDLGYAYAKAGRGEEARAELRNLQNDPPGIAGRHYDMALIHLALGDKAQALRHLETEDAHMPHLLNALRYDPRLAPLRSEPRFSSLVGKLSSGGRQRP